ncbi:MAG: methyltransferase domain-containing protein [Firmicutes bacterium]|nr:methyltransferase domain-containing protein [Bacillota bacterium]
MDKKDVIEFFDRWASRWDDDMVRDEEIIKTILDNWGIKEGMDVLDVACGTGVLIPDYFLRGAASVTGIDISPKMAEIARTKFPEALIITGDVEDYPFAGQFDAVMVYNAFPHFPDPGLLIERLAALTRPGGRLSVAHGMSREKLVGHHSGSASRVSVELIDERSMAELFGKYFDVDVMISDERMYQVCGTRRP